MIFEGLYRPYAEEREIFGRRWCGPEMYEHTRPVLVAVYEKDPHDGDGQRVEVWASAFPARFYEARVQAETNGVGKGRPAYTISTGSGLKMARLIAALAEAVTQGMIGFKELAEEEGP